MHMTRISTLIPVGLLAGAVLLSACNRAADSTSTAVVSTTSTGDPRAMQVAVIWRADIDSLATRIERLDSVLVSMSSLKSLGQARAAFVEARRTFKHAEAGLEYYAATSSREMNGPALPEVEENEGPEAVFPPTGFQVIEEGLYGADPLAERDALVQEVRTLRQILFRVQTLMRTQIVTDDRVWDAAKLELARIASLGLAGFDSPVAGHALGEADAALEGVARSLAPYRTHTPAWATLDSTIGAARAMLQAGADRESFDHFAFIVDRLNPLARALRETRVALGIGTPTERRAFRMEAASLFDSAAFDVMAFAPLDAVPATAEAVALGRTLFHDLRLSGDGQRACSSCHIPGNAFTDGLRVNTARGGSPLARNTPTVINSGVQLGVFSDLRTTYLEDQVTDVVENVDEMHGSLETSARVLSADRAVAARFAAAFAGQRAAADSVVTAARIRTALAAYQRSLTRLNAPVDRALRGDTSALSAEARLGFNVFVGKGKCATCHFLPLTNGTVPPMYQKSEVEVLGTPVRADTARGTVDPDVGRHRLSRAEPHRYAFRTPSLRNVALTAPYMHNGAYPTLESVIDFYNRGGGAGIGIGLDNQTLPPDPLNLTAGEQRNLVTFLRALTDTTGTGRR